MLFHLGENWHCFRHDRSAIGCAQCAPGGPAEAHHLVQGTITFDGEWNRRYVGGGGFCGKRLARHEVLDSETIVTATNGSRESARAGYHRFSSWVARYCLAPIYNTSSFRT